MTVWWAKPTLDDIASQRAMLERGEEKRKADWKRAERERLRDSFAAAALTGLLSNSIATEQAMSQYIRIAAAYADAMLREREQTNHDAVPEAKATNDGGTPKDADGTGNTPSEAEIDALEFVVEEGRTASVDDYGILRSWLIRLRPEWESQSYDEGDEKRMNANTSRVEDEIAIEAAWERTGLNPTWPDDEPGCGVKYAHAMADEILRLREAILRIADQDATLSVQGGNVTVTLDATLTDEEREAILTAADLLIGSKPGATLRRLLERLK